MRAAHRAVMLSLVVLSGCTGRGDSKAQPLPPPSPPAAVPVFDSARAFGDLETQCAFGPRDPGSEGHERCRAWLVSQLQGLAVQTYRQQFSSRTPMGGPYAFENILGLFGSSGSSRGALLLAAHWDTRPVADQDPDPRNRNRPILGANDGASGVAVLLELARLMKAQPPRRQVIVAFLDAEDSGTEGAGGFAYDGFCIGSAHLAAHWPETIPWPAEMILLDLVGADGERNPRLQGPGEIGAPEFRLEGHSLRSAPRLVEEVWSTAERRGHRAFVRRALDELTDDHLPFIRAGVPAIDIVHVFPAEWHTVDDTPQHCSPDTLLQVGDTLVEVVWGP